MCRRLFVEDGQKTFLLQTATVSTPEDLQLQRFPTSVIPAFRDFHATLYSSMVEAADACDVANRSTCGGRWSEAGFARVPQ